MLRDLAHRAEAALVQFHEDEEGMETMQVVMILAIGAMVIVLLYSYGDKIKKWAGGTVEKATGKDEF